MTNQDNAAQPGQDPIHDAIHILTEAADEIRVCHAKILSDGALNDWTDEPEAKAHYDCILAVVDSLSKLRAPVARTAQANMFWDAHLPDEIHDTLDNAMCAAQGNHGLMQNDTIEIQQAVKLPALEILVTEGDEDGDVFKFEIIKGNITPQASDAVRDAALTPLLARALAEWHEDDGPVTWWAWCGHEWAGEAPWCGTPLYQDWPGYHTHWTPIPGVPAALSAQPAQAQSSGNSGELSAQPGAQKEQSE